MSSFSSSKPKLKKKFILTSLFLVVVFGGIFAFNGIKSYFINKFFSTFQFPPAVVSTTKALEENWQPSLNTVGTLSATNGIDINPEVPGQVLKIFFQSGDMVKKGDKLFQLEDKSERAQKKNLEAQYSLARKNLRRAKQLFAQKATSQSFLDDATTQEKQLRANLEDIQATLAKKLIRAPFDGRMGIKLVNKGQFVSVGQVLATLQSNKSLLCNFSIAQKDLSRVKTKQHVELSVDTFPKLKFHGYINAIDSKVDNDTRTVHVQAAIDNTDGKLVPGMFVDLKILLPIVHNAVTLEQTAITYTLYGNSAFLVQHIPNQKDIYKVKRIFVRTGDFHKNRVLILEGVKPGDVVVNSGQSKIQDGARIKINNAVKLDNGQYQ